MQQKISLKLLPHEASDVATIKNFIAKSSGKKLKDIFRLQYFKKIY